MNGATVIGAFEWVLVLACAIPLGLVGVAAAERIGQEIHWRRISGMCEPQKGRRRTHRPRTS